MAHLQPKILFQQDGAPPHCCLMVPEYADDIFHYDGVGFPQRNESCMNEFRVRITYAVASVTREMAENTWCETAAVKRFERYKWCPHRNYLSGSFKHSKLLHDISCILCLFVMR
jgi:hypothetical protein